VRSDVTATLTLVVHAEHSHVGGIEQADDNMPNARIAANEDFQTIFLWLTRVARGRQNHARLSLANRPPCISNLTARW
jgi:hypothetical protein